MMKIHESAENYLETILMLKNKNGFVRSVDIANQLSYSKPSVSVAMKSLRENGYITVEPDGCIILTADGLSIASKIYERHQVLALGLMALGVDEKTAYADSCKIEHDISAESFHRIKEHLIKNGILQQKNDS